MVEDLFDAQLSGNGTGVLPGGASEGNQDVVARVATLGDGNRADRLDHVPIGNRQQSLGQFVEFIVSAGGFGDLIAEFCQPSLDGLMVERERKSIGRDLTLEEIQVRYGKRATPSVTCGARIGARTVRTDHQFDAIEMTD